MSAYTPNPQSSNEKAPRSGSGLLARKGAAAPAVDAVAHEGVNIDLLPGGGAAPQRQAFAGQRAANTATASAAARAEKTETAQRRAARRAEWLRERAANANQRRAADQDERRPKTKTPDKTPDNVIDIAPGDFTIMSRSASATHGGARVRPMVSAPRLLAAPGAPAPEGDDIAGPVDPDAISGGQGSAVFFSSSLPLAEEEKTGPPPKAPDPFDFDDDEDADEAEASAGPKAELETAPEPQSVSVPEPAPESKPAPYITANAPAADPSVEPHVVDSADEGRDNGDDASAAVFPQTPWPPREYPLRSVPAAADEARGDIAIDALSDTPSDALKDTVADNPEQQAAGEPALDPARAEDNFYQGAAIAPARRSLRALIKFKMSAPELIRLRRASEALGESCPTILRDALSAYLDANDVETVDPADAAAEAEQLARRRG
ncbi:MAG: hypothetical protein AAFW81_00805 [Pseudomonadota bacterium]